MLMGLVLVFDLDQTVIDTETLWDTSGVKQIFSQSGYLNTDETNSLKKLIYDNLNKKVAEIILRAAIIRSYTGLFSKWPRNQVSAICLLTNNLHKTYIALVDEVFLNISGLSGLYGSGGNKNVKSNSNLYRAPFFFDYIMYRKHPSRLTNTDNPPKRLQDVNIMLKYLNIHFDISGKPDNNSNLFFFDDRDPKHLIHSQIPPENYIQITPPFNIRTADKTDYSAILDILDSIDHTGKVFSGIPPFCTGRNCFGRPTKGGSRRIKNGFKKRRRTVKST